MNASGVFLKMFLVNWSKMMSIAMAPSIDSSISCCNLEEFASEVRSERKESRIDLSVSGFAPNQRAKAEGLT